MKIFYWGLLLAIVTAISFFYRPSPRMSVPEPVAPAQTQKVSAVVPAQKKVRAPILVVQVERESPPVRAPQLKAKTTAEKEKEQEQRYARPPRDMYVDVDIVDDLAIAFGDTILGTISPDFTLKRGSAELAYPKYWTGGVIPYVIQSDVVNPDRVKKAIDYFNAHTSVKFVPHENQSDAIAFVVGEKNCASFLGRVGGVQPIFLSPKCGTSEITHELMHALGFVHEQSRTDRDQHVDILWQNIEKKFMNQFAMVPEPLMESYFDSAFDPASIMMYDPRIFAVGDGLETMKLKGEGKFAAQNRMLSQADVERVNRLYPKTNAD